MSKIIKITSFSIKSLIVIFICFVYFIRYDVIPVSENFRENIIGFSNYFIDNDNEKGILISTFMSPFDVHVQRAPVTGKIVKTQYYPGKFKIALGNVDTENEKNLIVIDSQYGKIGVIQIAGFVARRIVQYVNVGDNINMGDRLGMIRFGSRVNLIIPYSKFKVMVFEGEKPTAGETIMAKLIE